MHRAYKKYPWGPCLAFAFLIFLPVFFFSRKILGAQNWTSAALWSLFTASIGAGILRTGRVSPWRALFFITMTAGFLIRFKSDLLGSSGRLFTTESLQEVPYCHIAAAASALNALYSQYLAFMSGHWRAWGPLSLGILWLVFTLVLGQAWCSWVCFYGGIDEAFSRLWPRPPLRGLRVPRRLRDFPTALLIFLLLVSLSTLLPVFCLWLCPLKLTTAFLAPFDATRKLQLALMLLTGLVFLVGLPLLTGKRAFCGLLCPFGAWQAFFGRINPFRVSPLHESCIACGDCVQACPTFSIQQDEKGRPEVLSYCCRCGTCMDACTHESLRYTLLGKDLGSGSTAGGESLTSLWSVRTVFLFCSLTVAGTLGSLFIPAAIKALWRLL
ncbi:MAG: 4Fe-4S binding protein [Elusimicrobiota bacterium]|jgi:polyferredoxin